MDILDLFTDELRTFIWTTAKLITGFAFIAIPWELRYWRKELGYKSTSLVTKGFMSFAFFCGLNQFVNAMVLPASPWWAVILVSIPMMISAVVTWLYIRINREKIVNIFHLFRELMTFDTNTAITETETKSEESIK